MVTAAITDGRLSHDGSIDPRIHADLSAICHDLLSAPFASSLRALVLGGGYGRGEGGVWVDSAGDRHPYNDYDLVLIRSRSGPGPSRWIAEQRPRWSARCGVHVDVEVLEEERIPELPHSLTWYEFGAGHHLVWGDATCLAPLTRHRLDQVNPWEWGRLLVNRGMGILLAWWRQGPPPHPMGEDEDLDRFQERQLRKAWLALGDVLLADRGTYHHLLRERQQRMAALADPPSWIGSWHAAAQAKFLPTPMTAAERTQALVELASVFRSSLAAHVADAFRPLAGLVRSWQHLDGATWMRSGLPWRPLRERVRRGILSGLDSMGTNLCPFSGVAHLVRAWQACA